MGTKYENIIFGRFADLLGPELFTTLTLFFLTTLLTLVVLRKILTNQFNTQKCSQSFRGLEAIPTARPLYPTKFIGNMPLLLPLPETLNNIEEQSKKHGDIFKFIGLNQTFVVLLSGPLVQSLLKSTDYGHVIKEPKVYDPMKPFINNGVLVSKGPFWKGQRKILMRTQSFSSLKAYMKMLNKHSKELVNELQILFEDGVPQQISASISTAFLKIISGKQLYKIF